MEKCKVQVFKNWHHYRCSRNAVIDGYCKQHHPDSVKKRDEEAVKKYEEQKKQSPFYKLKIANERIAQLEAENKRLRECMKMAGLQCFIMNGTPEEIAAHMQKIAASWLETEKRLREAARHTMQMFEDEYGGMLEFDDEGLEPQTSYRKLKNAIGNCSKSAAETKQNEKEN